MEKKRLWARERVFLSLQAKVAALGGRLYVTHTRPFLRWEQAQAAPEVAALTQGLSAHVPAPYTALLVLVFPCPPYALPLPTAVVLPSRYYLRSQSAYRSTALLAEWLRAEGYAALAHPKLPHRAAALRAGVGSVGHNRLLLTRDWGSYVHLQLLLTDALEGEAYAPAAASELCRQCGACVAACPTGALSRAGFDGRRCIREGYDAADIPGFMRPHVDRLVGCERCQAACPVNARVTPQPIASWEAAPFALQRLLAWERDPCVKREVAALLGKNMVTRNRPLHTALLVAANRGCGAVVEQVRELTHSPNPHTAALVRECLCALDPHPFSP